MRTFEELFRESSALHGHHCAGQILGVRMAMAGCREVGIDEPRGCKKLIVQVEIDRCATDAVQTVTGCSLGKRTLKFLDYGKGGDLYQHGDAKSRSTPRQGRCAIARLRLCARCGISGGGATASLRRHA